MLTRLLRRPLTALVIAGSALALLPDCGEPDEPMALDTSVDLLDSFELDTGPIPSSGPVQVSLTVKGSATAKVHLPATASEASGKPALYAPSGGAIEVSGGFTLDGSLKVDQSGVPSYDGDIPGLADVALGFSGTAAVADFAIASPVTVTAAITPGDLPPIPLPGGIPGHLQLSVAEGSAIDVTLTGLCAGIDGAKAEYRASAVRSGSVNLAISVDIDVPIVGTKTFDIGTVTVPLPESTYDIDASKDGVALGDAPEGSSPAPSCSAPVEQGAGGGDTTSSVGGSASTSGGPECVHHEDCPAGEGCTPQGTCKEVTFFCVNQTMRIDHLTLTNGDREFGGNGPAVTFSMMPLAVPEGLEISIDLTMQEVGSDMSTGVAKRTFVFPTDISAADYGLVWKYTDDDTTLDVLGEDAMTQTRLRCMGDNPGQDICDQASCSYCEIDLGCFPVLEK